MTRHATGRPLTALLALAFLAASAALARAAPAADPIPDQAVLSGKDVVLYPPVVPGATIRFLPSGLPVPFDRSITLSAAPGESRSYTIQLSSGDRDNSKPRIQAYTIDKRRPGSPKAAPGTGLYSAGIKPTLSDNKGGARIFWALVGNGDAQPSFSLYGENSRPELKPPSSGTVTYTLIAFEVDAAGNSGYPARFVYRMAEPGLSATAPVSDSATISADASLTAPEVDAERGYTELRLATPAGTKLLLNVRPDAPPSSIDDFERIDPEDGVARVSIPCPYAWSDDVQVYFGQLKDGLASYNPAPLRVHIANPAEQPIEPESPVLAADPWGKGAFAIFPSYQGVLYVSVDTADPTPYTAPLALPEGRRSVRLSWFGQDASGRRSATRSQDFDVPAAIDDIALNGIADGAVVGGDVTLTPVAKGTLRYELRLDGSIPPEPGSSSPAVGDSLAITCPPGEERSIVLRYRTFEGDSASEGRILRFNLDRKPPDAPRPSESPSSFNDKTTSVVLLAGQGGKDIFASVSADGVSAPFLPVTGPIELVGSDTGPVSYVLRTYDVDAAGNRSEEMKVLRLVVDRTSIYVSDDGSDKGDGSPDKPFKSFDAALAAALKAGKRNVNMRGSLEMRVPVRASTKIFFAGGFGKLWARDPSARASLHIAVPASQPAFAQSGGALSFSQADVAVDASGAGSVIALSDASLSIEDSSFAASADGDCILVSATRSKVDLKSARIKAARAMAFTAFSSDGSDISLAGSSVSAAQGVRIFGAFDMDGGSLSLRESLLESRADLGLNLLALRSASLLVDRSLIKAEGGSGFLRLGSLKAVTGEVRTSKVLLSWNGPGVLFEIAEGGPAFRFDTLVAESSRGGLRFFDSRGAVPEIWDSILECSGAGSEMLRSDSPPGAGAIVADCVFGFDKLLAGAVEAADLEALNDLNAGSALYSSKPNISEPPERTFAAPLKSLAPLRADSACVNAALPLEGPGYGLDFSGKARPGRPAGGAAAGTKPGPDIGADELDG